MNKTLEQQIADRCIHFNGIMNECCKAGVRYEDVRVGRPYQFPCLKQGGECGLVRFRTAQEVQTELAELKQLGLTGMKVFILVKDHYEKTNQETGTIECVCGGKLVYSASPHHDHLHVAARCASCNTVFNGH